MRSRCAHIKCAHLALLVFDYVLTLEEEVEYIWSSSNSLYVLLFFANRLAMVGMAVGSVVGMVPWYSILVRLIRSYPCWAVWTDCVSQR